METSYDTEMKSLLIAIPVGNMARYTFKDFAIDKEGKPPVRTPEERLP